MTQIVHKRGVFRKFRSLSNIHMGAYEMDLPAQSEVEFDGMVLRWGDEKYNLPLFAGAINAKWAVPIEDNVSRYIPQPAGIEVRPATSDGPERGAPMEVGKAPDEEDVLVGTVEGNNARREAVNHPPIPVGSQESMDRAASLAEVRRQQAAVAQAAVLAEEAKTAKTTVGEEPVELPSIQHSDDDDPAETVIQSKFFDDTPKVTHNGMEIVSEDQQAVPVATIGSRSSATVGTNALGGARTVLSNASQAATAVRMAKATRPIRTAKVPVVPAPKPTSKVKWKRTGLKPAERAVVAVDKYGSNPDSLKQVMKQETDQVRRLIRKKIKDRV